MLPKKSADTILSYFSIYMFVCSAFLALLSLTNNVSYGLNAPFLTAILLLTAYCFLYGLHKLVKSPTFLHVNILVVSFMITLGALSFLFYVAPDTISRVGFVVAGITLTLCVALWLGAWAKKLTYNDKDDNEDVSLLTSLEFVTSNPNYLSKFSHPVIHKLIGDLASSEIRQLFPSKFGDVQDHTMDTLTEEIHRSIMDGYILGIVSLQRKTPKLTMMKSPSYELLELLWHESKHIFSPNTKTQSFKHSVMLITNHKIRQKQRKINLATVPYMKRAIVEADDKKWIRLGYNVAYFEDYMRSDAGKKQALELEATIRNDFFTFVDLCNESELEVALDGKQSLDLIVNGKPDIGLPTAHFGCTNEEIESVLKLLAEKKFECIPVEFAKNEICRYEIRNPELKHLGIYLTIYFYNEEDGLYYDKSDSSMLIGFAGLNDYIRLPLGKRQLLVMPPSFNLQQLLYFREMYPENKSDVWAKEYDIISEKYFKDVNILTDPLFAYIPLQIEEKMKNQNKLYSHEDDEQLE